MQEINKYFFKYLFAKKINQLLDIKKISLPLHSLYENKDKGEGRDG